MRIRVIQKPPEETIDGITLDRFFAGGEYEVGNLLAAVMLAEGWAEPVTSGEQATPAVLDDAAPAPDPMPEPPNLVREIYPPYYDGPPALAADRRRKPRTRSSD